MKNFFALIIVSMALLAVSCGGNANKPAEEVEAVEVVVEEVAADSTAACCADSTCCAEGAECKGTAEACKAPATAEAAK